MHQRSITEFRPPPSKPNDPQWLRLINNTNSSVSSSSSSFSLHELLSQKTNLRFQSNSAQFRFSSGAACTDDQDQLLNSFEVLNKNQNENKTSSSTSSTQNDGNNDNQQAGQRRQREIYEGFFDIVTSNNNNNNSRDNEDEDDEDSASSPLSGFVNFAQRQQQQRRQLANNNNNNNNNNNKNRSAVVPKVFTKLQKNLPSRGNGRDPRSFVRQLSSSFCSSTGEFSMLSVAPGETLFYRGLSSSAATSNSNGLDDSDNDEVLGFYQDRNYQTNNREPYVLEADYRNNTSSTNNRNHHQAGGVGNFSNYTNGTFFAGNHEKTAVLTTNKLQLHSWDLERLFVTRDLAILSEQDQQYNNSSNSSFSIGARKTMDRASGIISFSSSSVLNNNNNMNNHHHQQLVGVCVENARTVQLFDLRLSDSTARVCHWGSTGKEISSFSNTIVSFADNTNVRNNGTFALSSSFNNSGGLLSSAPSAVNPRAFGIVGLSATSSNQQQQQQQSLSSSSNQNGRPTCMCTTQTSAGTTCIVVADSEMMIRVWDLRKVGPKNCKPLYTLNFREAALAAIDHALPLASTTSNGSPTFSSNSSCANNQRNLALGTISSMKPDPSHPLSVWINTSGGFVGRVEFSSSSNSNNRNSAAPSCIPHAFYSDDSYRSPLQVGLPPLQMDVLGGNSTSNNHLHDDDESVMIACPRLFSGMVLVAAATDLIPSGYQQQQQRRQAHYQFPFHGDDNRFITRDALSNFPVPVACCFAGRDCDQSLVVEDQFRNLWIKKLF